MSSRRSIPGVAALALALGLTLAGTLLGAPAAMAQDTTPPTLVKVEYEDATVRLTFSEVLDETSVPDRRHFRVSPFRRDGHGGGASTIESPATVAISGSVVMLTLHAPSVKYSGFHARYEWDAGVGGSKLRDPAGNNVATTPFTRGVWSDLNADITPPVLSHLSADTSGRLVRARFTELLEPYASLDYLSHLVSAFTLTVDGAPAAISRIEARNKNGAPPATSGIEALNKWFLLFLSQPIAYGQSASLSYDKTALAVAERLRDAAGNEVESFTGEPAENHSWQPPTGRVEGMSLSMTFGGELDPESRPSGKAFTVTTTRNDLSRARAASERRRSGSARTISGTGTAQIAGSTVTVRLASAVAAGESASVSYTRPSDGAALRAANGDEVPDFSGEPVMNEAPDEDAPTVAQVEVVSDAGEDGTYALGDRIQVGLTFSAAVDVTGAPRLKLDMDPADGGEKWAAYESGGGTSTLTLAYEVVEPDVSTQGIAVLADTLELNGGTIKDAGTDLDAALAHEGLGHDPNHKVNWQLTNEPSASNTPATGAPTIAGTARVGETLTAGTADIADADGLSEATFAYQWLMNDGGADAEVAGATGASHTLADTESGATVKVRVTFTDDAGNKETLTSAATETVAPRLPPLTASFVGVPAEHDGKTEFSFELRFSEDFPGRLPYSKLKDEALQATNGRVTGAARAAPNQNQRWTIRVRPWSSDDVTVTLPAAEDCAAAGAICTEAGRKLSNTTSATIAFESGDTVPARFESAETAEAGRGLILTFTKEILAAGLHTNYTVLVDGERRETRHASWPDNTVGLVLAEPVRWGETVTVAYAKPSSGAVLRDADDLAIDSFGPEVVANTVLQPENNPATGAPTIAGTARVRETLTASTAGIVDADGLTGAAFAWQWLSNDADIAGATGASYTLADAQEGAAVKVRVTFTDDAGNEETLTSAATEAVAPPLPPLTASFVGVPSEHDGKTAFSFELRFSEDFPGRLPYKKLKEHALQATNGRIVGAERMAPNQNQRWTIRVRPWSAESVTVSMSATTDCNAAGGICTPDGRRLSNANEATVIGPVGISVADARVEEGAGAVLAFAVTLSRAATSVLRVDYATSDGSARAGEDYTAASGTLSFPAGETSASVEVGVLDDAHDEGEETLTLRLSNASGGVLAVGEATGTIENADLMPAALLARFGRATAEQVVEHIEERMAAPRRRGFRARFAGRELQPGSEGDFALGLLSSFAQPMGMGRPGAAMGGATPMAPGPHAAGSSALGMGTAGMGGVSGPGGVTDMGGTAGAMGMAGQHSPMGGASAMGGYGPAGGAHGSGLFGSMAPGGDLFSNSELELNRESRGGILSVWSRSSRSYFSGMEDALSLDGDVRTTMVGADYARGPLTVGLSVGRTLGLGGYSGPSGGRMSTSMTGFYPWVGYQVNDRVSVWGVTGYGTGALSLTPDGASALETGVSMAMSALGTRGELIGSRATGGFSLAFKADAMWVGAASELLDGPAGRLNASEAGVTRVRTALEGSRGFTLGGGRLSLTPSVEVGLRRDGGDAETGAGMDVGGGLAFTDTVTGLSLDVRVRTLVVHQADGFSDRGMSLSFGWDPTPSSPLGLTARVAPTWGGSAQGGAEALWGSQMAYGSGSHQMHGGGERVDAEVGYGLPVGARLVGTPRVGVSASPHGRDYRVGYVLGVLDQETVSFELGIDAQRREIPEQGEASNGVQGRATIGW